MDHTAGETRRERGHEEKETRRERECGRTCVASGDLPGSEGQWEQSLWLA